MADPQTRAELDAYIAAQVAAAQAEAEKEIADQRAKAEAYITTQFTEKKSELNMLDQRLANDFIGFRIGGIAPAYSTSNASVYIRDALGLSASTGGAPVQAPGGKVALALVVALAAYYFLKKGK